MSFPPYDYSRKRYSEPGQIWPNLTRDELTVLHAAGCEVIRNVHGEPIATLPGDSNYTFYNAHSVLWKLGWPKRSNFR
jgi:hypothetical protein